MNTSKITSPLVSVSWLSEHINDPDLIVLDATIKKVTSDTRENNEQKNIKNTRFFDIKKAFSNTKTDIPNMLPSLQIFEESCRDLGISNHHKIVVYDKLGIYSSARVWWMLKIMGHTNVAVLDGGFPEWQKVNLPCESESDTTNYKQGDFKASFIPDLVSNANTILQEMNNKNTLILDARSPGRFKAEEPEPRASLKGGHIPNSMNLHYNDVLDNGKMKSEHKLKEILADFNIENKKLIFTCGSGITACIIMLAAELAGYKNMSVYDGSWSEWGQLSDVPIQC
ncbi:sulfurtransferase [Aquimarina sp. AU474]|uniref:sulfurtransferase n=1 Tax=Aquimarina sp. AU474 TaxID=2108529 RepID=UPI001F1C86F7|nr:sulfurtransferase [Aquimarina sp. AU474]